MLRLVGRRICFGRHRGTSRLMLPRARYVCMTVCWVKGVCVLDVYVCVVRVCACLRAGHCLDSPQTCTRRRSKCTASLPGRTGCQYTTVALHCRCVVAAAMVVCTSGTMFALPGGGTGLEQHRVFQRRPGPLVWRWGPQERVRHCCGVRDRECAWWRTCACARTQPGGDFHTGHRTRAPACCPHAGRAPPRSPGVGSGRCVGVVTWCLPACLPAVVMVVARVARRSTLGYRGARIRKSARGCLDRGGARSPRRRAVVRVKHRGR